MWRHLLMTPNFPTNYLDKFSIEGFSSAIMVDQRSLSTINFSNHFFSTNTGSPRYLTSSFPRCSKETTGTQKSGLHLTNLYVKRPTWCFSIYFLHFDKKASFKFTIYNRNFEVSTEHMLNKGNLYVLVKPKWKSHC